MRKLLQAGNVPRQYWTCAFSHAVYLHNNYDFRTNGSTPWETLRQIYSEVNPCIQLPPFGCKITSYDNQTTQRVFRENFNGTFFGFHFSTKIAIVLLPNGKLIRTSSFHTFDSIYPFKQLHRASPNINSLGNDDPSNNYFAGSGHIFGYGTINSYAPASAHPMTTSSISNTRNKKTKKVPPKPTFGTTINDVQAAKNSSSQLPPINSNPTPPIFELLPETGTTENSLVLVPQRNTDDDQSSFTELSTADARLTTASNSLENSLLPSEITV